MIDDWREYLIDILYTLSKEDNSFSEDEWERIKASVYEEAEKMKEKERKIKLNKGLLRRFKNSYKKNDHDWREYLSDLLYTLSKNNIFREEEWERIKSYIYKEAERKKECKGVENLIANDRQAIHRNHNLKTETKTVKRRYLNAFINDTGDIGDWRYDLFYTIMY